MLWLDEESKGNQMLHRPAAGGSLEVLVQLGYHSHPILLCENLGTGWRIQHNYLDGLTYLAQNSWRRGKKEGVARLKMKEKRPVNNPAWPSDVFPC